MTWGQQRGGEGRAGGQTEDVMEAPEQQQKQSMKRGECEGHAGATAGAGEHSLGNARLAHPRGHLRA